MSTPPTATLDVPESPYEPISPVYNPPPSPGAGAKDGVGASPLASPPPHGNIIVYGTPDSNREEPGQPRDQWGHFIYPEDLDKGVKAPFQSPLLKRKKKRGRFTPSPPTATPTVPVSGFTLAQGTPPTAAYSPVSPSPLHTGFVCLKEGRTVAFRKFGQNWTGLEINIFKGIFKATVHVDGETITVEFPPSFTEDQINELIRFVA